VHDYYADTRIAWDIVHEYIAAGKTLAVKNVVTGTVTTETDLAGKAGALARYKDGQGIDIPEPYHRQTWELICKVVNDLSDAALAKA
jgi:hypothetical protein